MWRIDVLLHRWRRVGFDALAAYPLRSGCGLSGAVTGSELSGGAIAYLIAQFDHAAPHLAN